MASATLTYTGKTGPAQTITAGVYKNATQIVLDLAEQTVTLFNGNTWLGCFDYSPVTTFTASISAAGVTGVTSITLS